MPKMKSKSGAKKRFRTTASGRFKRGTTRRRHKLTSKTTKRKRRLRKPNYVDQAQHDQVQAMLPYMG